MGQRNFVLALRKSPPANSASVERHQEDKIHRVGFASGGIGALITAETEKRRAPCLAEGQRRETRDTCASGDGLRNDRAILGYQRASRLAGIV